MITVVETPAYLRSAKEAGMSETEMAAAINLLAINSEAGDLMVGTGGCRKVRLAGKGKGKSGGYRLITFVIANDRAFLLTVFAKGDKANLTTAESNALKAYVETL